MRGSTKEQSLGVFVDQTAVLDTRRCASYPAEALGRPQRKEPLVCATRSIYSVHGKVVDGQP